MGFTATSCTDITGHPYLRAIFESDGQTIMRNLTVAQMIEVLGKSVVEERQYVRLKDDFFPKTAKATWFSDYENFSCVWEVPAAVRLLILKTPVGPKHYHVPFPKLIFRINVKNGQVLDKYCYAMKKGTDNLFCYPFGNVAKGGSICMGNISMKDMKSVSDFSDAFFSGVTNNDFFGSDGNGKVSVKFTQEQLLEKLSGLKSFPDSFLAEEKGLTLKMLCDKAPDMRSNY